MENYFIMTFDQSSFSKFNFLKSSSGRRQIRSILSTTELIGQAHQPIIKGIFTEIFVSSRRYINLIFQFDGEIAYLWIYECLNAEHHCCLKHLIITPLNLFDIDHLARSCCAKDRLYEHLTLTFPCSL